MKTYTRHVYFAIVEALRRHSQMAVKREKDRASMKASVAGLVTSAQALIADQKNDAELQCWATSAASSGSIDLILSFPERSQGVLLTLIDNAEIWSNAILNGDAEYLRACHTRGISLTRNHVELLQRAITDSDPDFQDLLLEALAPYVTSLAGTLKWTSEDFSKRAAFICEFLRIAIKAQPDIGVTALNQAVSRNDGLQYALLRLCGADASSAKTVSNHRWISAIGPHSTAEALLADATQRRQVEAIFQKTGCP
jgi:hypothetical protein